MAFQKHRKMPPYAIIKSRINKEQWEKTVQNMQSFSVSSSEFLPSETPALLPKLDGHETISFQLLLYSPK